MTCDPLKYGIRCVGTLTIFYNLRSDDNDELQRIPDSGGKHLEEQERRVEVDDRLFNDFNTEYKTWGYRNLSKVHH